MKGGKWFEYVFTVSATALALDKNPAVSSRSRSYHVCDYLVGIAEDIQTLLMAIVGDEHELYEPAAHSNTRVGDCLPLSA